MSIWIPLYFVQFLPAPIVAGYCISQFFMKKNLPSYFIFVVSASLPISWFVVHNYWGLNIWLDGMALRSLCKFIIASSVLAMVILGLALLPPKVHIVIECGLIIHTFLVCYIENRLCSYTVYYHLLLWFWGWCYLSQLHGYHYDSFRFGFGQKIGLRQ